MRRGLLLARLLKCMGFITAQLSTQSERGRETGNDFLIGPNGIYSTDKKSWSPEKNRSLLMALLICLKTRTFHGVSSFQLQSSLLHMNAASCTPKDSCSVT